MKHLLIVLLCIFMGAFSSCDNDDGDPPIPVTCSDGIQNQDETGIDCGGGICPTCFDCFSEFCTYLSGRTFAGLESTIKWDCVLYNGRDFLPEDKQEVTESIFASHLFEFSSKGRLFFTGRSVTNVEGLWEFDNPDAPTEISTFFPSGVHEDFSLDLISLDRDTLVLAIFEDEGTFVRVN